MKVGMDERREEEDAAPPASPLSLHLGRETALVDGDDSPGNDLGEWYPLRFKLHMLEDASFTPIQRPDDLWGF